MAGKLSCCSSGEIRWTRTCKRAQGMMWMKRLLEWVVSATYDVKRIGCAHEVTLSKLWKTRLFRHIAIATALLPNARQ